MIHLRRHIDQLAEKVQDKDHVVQKIRYAGSSSEPFCMTAPTHFNFPPTCLNSGHTIHFRQHASSCFWMGTGLFKSVYLTAQFETIIECPESLITKCHKIISLVKHVPEGCLMHPHEGDIPLVVVFPLGAVCHRMQDKESTFQNFPGSMHAPRSSPRSLGFHPSRYGDLDLNSLCMKVKTQLSGLLVTCGSAACTVSMPINVHSFQRWAEKVPREGRTTGTRTGSGLWLHPRCWKWWQYASSLSVVTSLSYI